jgi:hypothetical protein
MRKAFYPWVKTERGFREISIILTIYHFPHGENHKGEFFMVGIYEQKGRNSIRVIINKADIEEMGLEEYDDATIKSWINGNKKEDKRITEVHQKVQSLESKIDKLENMLERFIKLSGFYHQQNYMFGCRQIFEIPFLIMKKKFLEKDSKELKHIRNLNAKSNLVRQALFPEYEIPTSIDGVEKFLEKDSEFRVSCKQDSLEDINEKILSKYKQ